MSRSNLAVVANNATTNSMREYYEKQYGKPKNDNEAIETLVTIFKELMDIPVISQDNREGIAEYYRVIKQRDLPAYVWLLEAFHVASKKAPEKRNFNYIVGMIRQWLKWGFGHIPSQEEEEVIDYFEEVVGEKISPKGRVVMQNLMGTYGAIKVARIIGKLERDVGMSYYKSLFLKDLMDDKWGSNKSK